MEPEKCKILLLGDSAVGKTTLFRRFTNNTNLNVAPTIGAQFKQKIITLDNGTSMKIQLWDTAGTERYRTLSPIYYRNLDGVLLIFDITDADSFDSLKYWIDQLTEKGEEVEIVLIGNKNDQKANRTVSQSAAQKMAKQLKAPYIETNALSEKGVNEPFDVLIRLISEKRRNQVNIQAIQMQSKRSEFQELKLKDLPKRKDKEGDDCC